MIIAVIVFERLLFSSFFESYNLMNGYRGDRNVSRELSTVDENDNIELRWNTIFCS